MARNAQLRLYSARLGLTLLVTAVSLLFGECVARVVLPRETFRPGIAEFRTKALIPDPILGWRVKPDADVLDAVSGVQYTFSRLGTRETTVTDDEKTVVVVGDSVTMGWGVPGDSTFPRRLRSLLSRPVLNGGVIGYGIEQDVARLKELIGATHARTALLGYFPNDPEGPESVAKEWGPTWSRLWQLVRPIFDRWTSKASHPTSMTEYHRALHAPGSATWDRVVRSFADLATFCRAQHIACGVALLPELTTRPYPLASEHARVAAVARGQGLPVLDLAPSVADVEPRTLWVAPDDTHPNAEGHRRYAEAIAPWMRTWMH